MYQLLKKARHWAYLTIQKTMIPVVLGLSVVPFINTLRFSA